MTAREDNSGGSSKSQDSRYQQTVFGTDPGAEFCIKLSIHRYIHIRQIFIQPEPSNFTMVKDNKNYWVARVEIYP